MTTVSQTPYHHLLARYTLNNRQHFPWTKFSWSHSNLLDLSPSCGEIGLVWSVSTIVDMSCEILPCPLHLLCLQTLRFWPGLAHCHLHSGSSYILHILYSHGNVVSSSVQLRSRVTAACIVHQQRNIFKLFLFIHYSPSVAGVSILNITILISLNNFGCEWWRFSPLIWTMSYCNIPHISSLSSPVGGEFSSNCWRELKTRES